MKELTVKEKENLDQFKTNKKDLSEILARYNYELEVRLDGNGEVMSVYFLEKNRQESNLLSPTLMYDETKNRMYILDIPAKKMDTKIMGDFLEQIQQAVGVCYAVERYLQVND
jgi:hypothetical protein